MIPISLNFSNNLSPFSRALSLNKQQSRIRRVKYEPLRDSGELKLIPDNSDAIGTLRVILAVRCVVFAHGLVVNKTNLSLAFPADFTIAISVVVSGGFSGCGHLPGDVIVLSF